MRIAMFTDTWLPMKDGCVTTILRFREGLERRGHKVFIFAPEDPTGQVKEDDSTFLFSAREFRTYPGYRMAMYPSRRKDRLLVENDIEFIHNHGLAFMGVKSMFSSRFLDLPVLLHFHTWVTDASQYYPVNLDKELMDRLTWRFLRSLCRRSDGVVAPSRSAIEELKEKVPGMAYTDWVSPGVDLERFNPRVRGDAVRERYGLLDNDIILHVGRVSLEKNLDLVIDAMPLVKKQRPGAKLMVVGEGPALDHYRQRARDRHLEDDVIFTDFVPDEELAAHYAAADAFVLASTFETLGIVMIEALATGKPVAAINHRVVPEVIQDGFNGYLFDHSPESCARAILRTLGSGEDLAGNAVSSARRFNTEDCITKLEGIYKKTIEVKESRDLARNK